MAYQSITNNNSEDRRKATEMEVGQSYEGYVVSLPETNGDFGEQTNIVIKEIDSEEQFLLYTAGTLKYDARDGRIKLGLKTKITRLEDEKRKAKSGKAYTTSVFEVLQDPDDSLYGEDDVQAAGTSSDIKERAKNLKNKIAK